MGVDELRDALKGLNAALEGQAAEGAQTLSAKTLAAVAVKAFGGEGLRELLSLLRSPAETDRADSVLVLDGGRIRAMGLDTLAGLLGAELPFIFRYDYDGSNAPTIEASDTASSNNASLFTTGGACEVTVNGVTVSVAAGVSFNLGDYMAVGENTVRITPLEGAMGSSCRSSAVLSTYRKHITEIVQWGTCAWGDCSYLLCRATALKSVPEFGAGFSEVTTFESCFQECSGLTSLPENLFANCTAVTDFSYCFISCTGLTAIPENLFANCTAVTDFSYCFSTCTGLTAIPENLFANCTKVTNFLYCFGLCTGLTAIPENLFANCTAVTDFSYCFSLCIGLTGESAYDRVEIDGVETIIHLYERENYPDLYAKLTLYDDCYYNCLMLDDYDAIPSGWK